MAPKPFPVESDSTLPASADVVVIGGGIAGTSTALELAERGIDVVLCEKGEIACEQSSRNWGWCRQMGRDPREIPLILESLRLWRNMNTRVGAETGFTECGILYLCETEEKLAKYEGWLDRHARPYQVSSRIVDGKEAARLAPGSSRDFKGALYTPNDGRAEPQLAASAMAHAIRAHGGKVFTQCAVRGIERQGGRVSGVVTEQGRIACSSVVLAGGAWSRHFCENMDIRLPQLTVTSSVFRTGAMDLPLEASAHGSGYAYRKRLDGGYTIAHGDVSIADIVPASFRYFFDFLPALRSEWRSLKLRFGERFWQERRLPKRWAMDQQSPFEQIRVLDPEPVDWVLSEARSNLAAAFPAFADVEVTESWAGVIDATPDAVPVISAVDDMPGFHMATGFSGHGFGLGPGAGKLMADIVTGKTPVVDPEPFRYSRMTDGTRLKPITGL